MMRIHDAFRLFRPPAAAPTAVLAGLLTSIGAPNAQALPLVDEFDPISARPAPIRSEPGVARAPAPAEPEDDEQATEVEDVEDVTKSPAAAPASSDETRRAAAAPAPPPPPPPTPEPLAGMSDGGAFLRSPDNFFQLFPGGRLQIDSYFFKSPNKVPNNSFVIRRARAELAGWVGPMFYFSMSGDLSAGPPPAADPVAPANLITSDAYGALAPWGNRVILQAGQFDAPFTLENRTSDKYQDLLERSLAVRAFGIPSNKELGLMVHGMLPLDVVYYSLGVFNGDGQNFRNADGNFDLMGRGWLSVLPPSMQPVVTLRLGGSFILGKRDNTLPVTAQSTPGGFSFWTPKWNGAGGVPLEYHQDGDVRAFAAELDVSVWHKFGLRSEWLHRRQGLVVADVSKVGALNVLGSGSISGTAGYVELWYWPIGDNLIVGEPGLQFPSRWKKLNADRARHGLMVTARLEHVREQVSDTAVMGAAATPSPERGSTRVWALNAGLNYWWSKRLRTSINYGLYSLSGSAPAVKALPSGREQELLLRLGFGL
jgi:hypothetical protein